MSNVVSFQNRNGLVFCYGYYNIHDLNNGKMINDAHNLCKSKGGKHYQTLLDRKEKENWTGKRFTMEIVNLADELSSKE